jgi:hypothetical protein
VKKLVGSGEDNVEGLVIICSSFDANRVLETDGDDVKGPGVEIDEAPAFRFVSWLRDFVMNTGTYRLLAHILSMHSG